MSNLTTLPAWQKLTSHYQNISNHKVADFFAEDSNRFNNFSTEAAGLFVDYSKQRITTETIELLCQLAKEVDLEGHIEKMFSGQPINITEKRAVLHTALRNPNDYKEVSSVLDKIDDCVTKIRNGHWKGYSGKTITDIVNIGIGGSDLGPAMVVQALTPYIPSNLHCHFVSNVDGTHICETLKNLNPETTLFIIASKTFTTQETLCNANTAKEWLEQKATDTKAIEQHLLAVSANPTKAREFGIPEKHVFPFWDWVGGRYSLWSSIGLSIAIAIGIDNFRALLAGAHAMDKHFRTTPFKGNLPVLLALLGIWNMNFFNAKTHAVLPYDQYMSLLPAYLQQLDMESNGKHVDVNGETLSYSTAPVVWGAPGTNGQHAFHQLLMQGTQMVPIDFILPLKSQNPIGQHHMLLVANCFAQSQALMQGKPEQQVIEELLGQGMADTDAKTLAPHKVIPGNNPSTTILTEKITPATLGALIALYEHKVFVQGIVWNINSFDQWGVELGKQLAKGIIPILLEEKTTEGLDCSTQGLIGKYLSTK